MPELHVVRVFVGPGDTGGNELGVFLARKEPSRSEGGAPSSRCVTTRLYGLHGGQRDSASSCMRPAKNDPVSGVRRTRPPGPVPPSAETSASNLGLALGWGPSV
jgi:hypothetical protein